MSEQFKEISAFDEQGGKNIVAGAFFELYKPFGSKYGFDESKINEEELSELIEKAGITEDEINTLVNAEVGELGASHFKKNIDTNKLFEKHPELIPIRNKFVKVLGGQLIEA